MRNSAIAAALVLACTAVAGSVHAQTFDTYVGYADSLRPSAFFPANLCTGTYWNGSLAGPSGNCGNQTMDSGAIDVVNTGTTNLSITGLQVTEKPNDGAFVYNIWGALNITLAPGQNVVFTQTSNSNNFDSSDNPFINNGNDPTNNCSTGAFSTTSLCTTNAPIVALTVDGSVTNLTDTGHVLDTGGYDSVNSNPCIGGNNNSGNTPGSCNESLQWRLIGTTGVDNPGGGTQVPEPGSVALLGLGIAGLVLARRRAAR